MMARAFSYSVLMCIVTLGLSGCSYNYGSVSNRLYSSHGLIHPPTPEYQLAKDDKSLVIPSDLSSTKLEPLYEVPETSADEEATNALSQRELLVLPSSLSAQPSAKQTQQTNNEKSATNNTDTVTQQGNQKVLLIQRPLADAFSYVVGRLPKAGFQVVHRDPAHHTIDIMQPFQGSTRLLQFCFASEGNNTRLWLRAPIGVTLSPTEAQVLLSRLAAQMEHQHD